MFGQSGISLSEYFTCPSGIGCDDLQAEIAKEYSKEFMCEGQMFYYYKRLGLKRIGVYRTVAIEPEEVYVIPLPDDELDFGLIE